MLRATGLTVLLLTCAAYGATLHVPSQYPTIQPAINAAMDGDTVLVADGVFSGANNKNLNFLGKAIVVASENGPDSCIIDCQHSGRGFDFHSTEDSTSVLSGFTIRHGNMFEGGGIYINNASPTIANCLIIQNTASGGGPSSPQGGGIFCVGEGSPFIFNCSVSENTAVDGGGGGICIDYSSSPIIDQCLISGNTAGSGGGIVCQSNNPNLTISHCTITRNTGYNNGSGGIYFNQGSGTLSDCIISDNVGQSGGGGGIKCDWNVIITISHCAITGNVSSEGGGLYAELARPHLRYCLIRGNISYGNGGGIYNTGSIPTLDYCTINGNSSAYQGGGIYCSGGMIIRQCTISRNSANGCGGLAFFESIYMPPYLAVENSIVEGNSGVGGVYFGTAEGVHASNNDFYDNEMGNLTGQLAPGLGQPVSININGDSCDVFHNIFADPLFEDPQNGNFQLTWADFPIPNSTMSPCIDAGNPDSTGDLDSTVADMGAFYFDQGPLLVVLTPLSFPIAIPANGGSFSYTIKAMNRTSTPVRLDFWCNATLPNGQMYGPVLGPLSLTLAPNSSVTRNRVQMVPGSAPAGEYHYNACLGAHPDSLLHEDSFPFTKLSADDGAQAIDAWNCSSEDFGAAEMPLITHNSAFIISTSPNPFNPTTVASFELRAASHVNLKIYDTAGRLVATLVEGWRDAGEHQVTFDGAKLASGVYLARLQAGTFTQTQKLVLLK
jgi:parallel beta-helix repeat protein/predicted outer membrane repeat protein